MPTPELIAYHPKPGCKLSIILLDWSVRESFHSLAYLNQQTVGRDQYELIWLEFYQRKPAKLQEMVFRHGNASPLLDQWIVAGYDRQTIFNKHRLYNLGLLLARGENCVICDSDAIFTPNFVAKLLEAFERWPNTVIHVDQIRNTNRRFHPFAYPTIDEILGPGCINWTGTTSKGLLDQTDRLHSANYGACMAARRKDLLAIGGADEHLDYLGYICGPYELTFRLVNRGLSERWIEDEFIYHVWHPNESGINVDFKGPDDGLGVSTRSLEARATGRIEPFVKNPWITEECQTLSVDKILTRLAEREEPTWKQGVAIPIWEKVVYFERDYLGFDLFRFQHRWYGLPMHEGEFDPGKAHRYPVLINAATQNELRDLVRHYNNLPKTLWGRLMKTPFHRIPWLAAKKIGKRIRRMF